MNLATENEIAELEGRDESGEQILEIYPAETLTKKDMVDEADIQSRVSMKRALESNARVRSKPGTEKVEYGSDEGPIQTWYDNAVERAETEIADEINTIAMKEKVEEPLYKDPYFSPEQSTDEVLFPWSEQKPENKAELPTDRPKESNKTPVATIA